MRRKLLALFLCCFLVPAANANPFAKVYHYVGHHKRFFAMEGAAIGGAALHAYGLNHCRRPPGDVERCDEGYGSAWAGFGSTTGFTVVVLPSVAEACWKHDGGKPCYALAFGGTAFQAAWGIHEYHSFRPEPKR